MASSRSDSQGIGLPQQVSGAGTNDYRSAALASQPDCSNFFQEPFHTGLFESEQDHFNRRPLSDVGELDARGPHSDRPSIGSEVPLGIEEGEVPMDCGQSEVNVLERDVFTDQFRRHENPGDLLSTTAATAAGSVVASQQPQQLVQNNIYFCQLGDKRELSIETSVSDGPGPVQASTPGPLAQPMQPQSVRSDISVVSSVADNPVQESVIWNEVNNSSIDGLAVHRQVEGSKQQLCLGVSTVEVVHFNHRVDSLSLPAAVDMSKIRQTPDSTDGDEVPMDCGQSEVNVPEGDQFRRHENPGGLLSTTAATAAGSVVASQQPQQLVQTNIYICQQGGERPIGTPVSDGPGPVQASTPGPLAQPMQQQHNFEDSIPGGRTTKLCGLRVMMPGHGVQHIVDIACLEGEKISSVVNARVKATEVHEGMDYREAGDDFMCNSPVFDT